jgi:1-aminocyclopropane-1-carboxylate deaminase/D-cysteine desulfhydrase-like pyridoxal-dependent ACC family enzyme
MLIANPVPNQALTHQLLTEKQIELSVKRLDLVHPDVSGNKFYKLKYNLQEANRQGKRRILTFGGAFSNHIFSTASAAQVEQLEAIAVIRGERVEPLNPTLAYAEKMGMKLYFISREEYRKKNTIEILTQLKELYGDFYLIPEGGTNELAIYGTSEILTENENQFSHIGVSIGTGGTFAGIAKSLNSPQKLIGFSSLKGEFIRDEIEVMLAKNNSSTSGSYEIITDYHFGGYAKYKPELIDFLGWFHSSFGIILDPIYTGKMAFGMWDLIKNDFFPAGSKLLMIHTGGLQGNAGFTIRTGIKIPE